MNSKRDDIDILLQSKLAEYEVYTSLPNFEDIVLPISNFRKGNIITSFSYSWLIAASLIFILISGIIVWEFGLNKISNNIPSLANIPTFENTNNIIDPNNQPITIESNPSDIDFLNSDYIASNLENYSLESNNDEGSSERFYPKIKELSKNIISPISINTVGQHLITNQQSTLLTGEERKTTQKVYSLDYDGQVNEPRWGISAYGAATKFSEATNQKVISRTNDIYQAAAVLSINQFSRIVNFEGADLKHKYPISVGALFRYDIIKGLGIESGLVYSYMQSEAETINILTYKLKQDIHYLGLPIYLSYDILRYKIVQPYINAGFMAEFAMQAKNIVSAMSSNNLIKTETNRINIGANPLFSTHFGIGTNIKILDYFALFLEPGVSYYFENKNHPVTYNTDNNFQFRIKFGMRFSL